MKGSVDSRKEIETKGIEPAKKGDENSESPAEQRTRMKRRDLVGVGTCYGIRKAPRGGRKMKRVGSGMLR